MPPKRPAAVPVSKAGARGRSPGARSSAGAPAEGAAAEASATIHSGSRLLLASLAVTLAVRMASAFTPSNWLWGVDTFHHWPPPWGAALAVLAALGFVPGVGGRIDHGLVRLGERWRGAGWRGDLFASGGLALALFALRDGVRFTGDFGMRVGLLSLPSPSRQLLEHVYPLDMAVNVLAPRWMWQHGMSDASALQLVGAFMGGLFALAAFRFLRAAGARGRALPAGALVMLSGALLVHFAGYDKFGPLLLGLVMAGAGAARMARDGRGIWTLALGTAIAVLSHRSGYLAVPAVAWTLVRGFAAERDGVRRFEIAAAAALAAGACAAMLPRTFEMVTQFDRAVHLPGGETARARAATTAPALLLHLSTALNVISYLVPMWLVGVAAGWTAWRSKTRPAAGASAARDRFALAPVGALAFVGFVMLVGVEPGGGWARDWDVATGIGTVTALICGFCLVAASRRDGLAGIGGPLVTVALAVCVTLWGVHASERISLRRVERLTTARPSWSAAHRAGLFDFLGIHALNAGRSDGAAALFERAIAVGGPNPRLVYQAGLAYLVAGRLERADSTFRRAAALDRKVAEPWVGRARIALATRDTLTALAYLDSAFTRNPTIPDGRQLLQALRGPRPAR